MEAIDDYANENIVRSIAYTALEKRQQHDYLGLMPISCQLLRQRVQILGDDQDMENVVQWQVDECPKMIETALSTITFADELYQKPVYYQRLDANTLHALIEFTEKDTKHFVVVLILEDGSGDVSDIKYYNTKEYNQEEWLSVFENWSRSIEDAERIFLTKVHKKKLFTAGTPDKEAPEDYWGEWSSDEAAKSASEHSQISEDEYYARWSKDTTQQEEINEEYDNSYNPLFTVPSVPNLMDAHTAALSELTNILQTSLPQRRPVVQPMTQINPLPKAVTRIKADELPGTYPESGTQSPKDIDQHNQFQEAGRGLFMKSLRALIGAANLLGYEGKDILEMVQEIVNNP